MEATITPNLEGLAYKVSEKPITHTHTHINTHTHTHTHKQKNVKSQVIPFQGLFSLQEKHLPAKENPDINSTGWAEQPGLNLKTNNKQQEASH